MNRPAAALPRTALLVTLIGATAALLSGCRFLFREEEIDPEFDVRDSSILVVPFEHDDRWFYESELGLALSRALKTTLNRPDCGRLILEDDASTHERVQEELEDPVPWTEVGHSTEVDFIVFGRIDAYRPQSIRTIGMVNGELDFTYTVWDVKNDDVGLQKNLTVTYPESSEDFDQLGTSLDLDQDRRQVRQKLMEIAARDVVDDLCGFIWDKVNEPRRVKR